MNSSDTSDIFFDKYYNLALRYLSFRPRSEKEIRDYLAKKSTYGRSAVGGKKMDILIDKIIEKLKEQRFLNDEEFARMWVESRIRSKPRAWRLIKIELKQKGISDEIIESATQSSEVSSQSDEEMAKAIVEKKINKYKNLPKQEAYQKLGRILAGKGFDWDTIKKVVDGFYRDRV